MNQTPLNLRRELIVVLVAVCCSAVILPGLIFAFGSGIFGPYDSADGIVGIYRAILDDLLALRVAAWIIVLGPALVIVLLRLTFRLTEPQAPATPVAPERTRREPTLNV